MVLVPDLSHRDSPGKQTQNPNQLFGNLNCDAAEPGVTHGYITDP